MDRSKVRPSPSISSKDWESTKNLIKGALEKVEKLQTETAAGSSSHSEHLSPAPQLPKPTLQRSAYEEHCNLFRFTPSTSSNAGKKRKGKGPLKGGAKKPKVTFWTKETICLRYTDQAKAPDTEEKMKLAHMGLGFKEIKFNTDGDAFHIHSILLTSYPELDGCGGYSLMRLGCGSSELVTIEPPKGGLNVRYLRDILKSAKLFVRPMQKDIEVKEEDEDEKVLQLHIESRECEDSEDDDLVERPSDSVKESVVDLTKFDGDSSLQDSSNDNLGTEEQMYNSSDNLDTEEQMYNRALEMSLEDSPWDEDLELPIIVQSSLADALKMLRQALSHEELLIEVRRDYILIDAIKEANKKKFDYKKKLNVTFVGEGAIDSGGPKREFFRVFASMASEKFLKGKAPRKFFNNDMIAIQKREFYILGVYTVMSILQGGPGLPIFAKPVYDYISAGQFMGVTVPLAEIPDPTLQFVLQRIESVKSNVDWPVVIAIDEVMDLLLETGYRKPISSTSVSDKQEIIASLIDYHCMTKVKAAMDQYIEGLDVLGVLVAIRNNPVWFEPLFVSPDIPLTSRTLKALLNVQYSLKGSNQRREEEQAYIHFKDFMDECEEGEIGCTLEEILIFFTGADRIPPLGFDVFPTMSFLYQQKLATASTCELQLRIPTIHGAKYDLFKADMILSLKGNDGFGGV